MKPRFAYKIIRPFIYTPAARTDISVTIRREIARLGERQVVRIEIAKEKP